MSSQGLSKESFPARCNTNTLVSLFILVFEILIFKLSISSGQEPQLPDGKYYYDGTEEVERYVIEAQGPGDPLHFDWTIPLDNDREAQFKVGADHKLAAHIPDQVFREEITHFSTTIPLAATAARNAHNHELEHYVQKH